AGPWLIVAGPSGSGKSSVVRAGAAPAIESGALGERARWTTAAFFPGRHPLSALAAALSACDPEAPADLRELMRREPGAVARWAWSRRDCGLLLVIDQLEEIFTLAEPEEREALLEVLAGFGALSPGVRVVATLR